MRNKIISAKEAAAMVKDGMTIMTGGFTFFGSPTRVIDALVEAGAKDMILIANDNGAPDFGVGKMISNRQFKKIHATHIARNPEAGRQLMAGETEFILIPQGTMAEKIRAGGSGIGGFYTPTGLGTEYEEGKEKRVIDGKEYLFEEGFRAEIAIIKANIGDRAGNLFMRRTAKNVNPLMAMAADVVIAEVDKVVEVGEIDPELITVPGILIDYMVESE